MAVRVSQLLISKIRVVLFTVFVLAALYLLAVTPVHTYISQHHQMARAEKRYEILADANKEMTTRITQLQSPQEVEQLAREQYELVPSGQEAFAVMPPAQTNPTPTKPKTPAHHSQSFLSRAWDDVTFWN